MRRLVIGFAALAAAFVCCAKDVAIDLDHQAAKRAFFSRGGIPVGYVADPKPGDEAAALACRRAGAWLFHTSVCDDATLAFLSEYGLRIVLVVDGDLKTAIGTLTRVATGKYAHVLAGVQLGSDPTGGEDLAKWRAVLSAVTRQKLKCPVALPVKDLESPILNRMKGYLGAVTHLAVDLRDTPAPFEKLQRMSLALEGSSDALFKRFRLWTIAPGRLPGTPSAEASSPATIAWQSHWFMTAFAIGRTDAVFFDRPCGADDFGLLLRHLWATTARTQNLVGGGESATAAKSDAAAPRKKAVAEDDLALDSGVPNVEDLAAALTAGMPLTACARVAEGKPGDLQYLALFANEEPNAEEGTLGRMGLLMVNTSGEKVRVTVKINTKKGGTGPGFRRRFVPDAKTGKMSVSLRERFGAVNEEIEPGEVTFVSFSI